MSPVPREKEFKQLLFLAVGVILILILLPLYRLDPNRVVRGLPMFFVDLIGGGGWLGSLGLGLAAFGLALLGWRDPLLSAMVGFLGLLGLPGWVGSGLVPEGGRLSPDLGFWGLQIWLLVPVIINEKKPVLPFRVLLAFLILILLAFQGNSPLSLFVELRSQHSRFLAELMQHLTLSGLSLAVAAVLALPLGVASAKTAWGGWAYGASSLVQTVPTLALLGFLMIPLSWLSQQLPVLRAWGVSGIGTAPAVTALAIYALLPLMTGIREGLRAVQPQVLQAARGLGLSAWQLFWKVEAPLSLPHVMAGIRTAAVQNLGNAALAPLIGAGGLGYFIFQGIGQTSTDMVLLGVLPLLGLTLGADGVLGMVEAHWRQERGSGQAGL